jgi:hypothetical protein
MGGINRRQAEGLPDVDFFKCYNYGNEFFDENSCAECAGN